MKYIYKYIYENIFMKYLFYTHVQNMEFYYNAGAFLLAQW